MSIGPGSRDASRADADLAAVVRRLDDERAIVELLHQTCHTIDGDKGEAWVACYTDDGVFAFWSAQGGEQVLDLRGRDALAEWFVGHRQMLPVGSQSHVTVNPVVALRGDEAEARSYYLTLREVDGQLAVASSGRYIDTLVRGDDDRWRIRERRAVAGPTRRSTGR